MEGSCSNHSVTALLILLAITSFIKSSSAASHTAESTSIEFIKSSCSATTYPQLCVSSLSSHATVIQTNPELLASTALSVTLSTARSTSTTMVNLSQTHGLKAREAAAMQDCVKYVSDSVVELKRSLDEMSNLKGSDFQLRISDLQTWVSAALTDDDMCTEGFADDAMNGNVKDEVKGQIVNIAHLTSNALALINNYASLHG